MKKGGQGRRPVNPGGGGGDRHGQPVGRAGRSARLVSPAASGHADRMPSKAGAARPRFKGGLGGTAPGFAQFGDGGQASLVAGQHGAAGLDEQDGVDPPVAVAQDGRDPADDIVRSAQKPASTACSMPWE